MEKKQTSKCGTGDRSQEKAPAELDGQPRSSRTAGAWGRWGRRLRSRLSSPSKRQESEAKGQCGRVLGHQSDGGRPPRGGLGVWEGPVPGALRTEAEHGKEEEPTKGGRHLGEWIGRDPPREGGREEHHKDWDPEGLMDLAMLRTLRKM